MNKRVKKLWLNALRGEDYEQADGSLKLIRGEKVVGYCCLGVLCDLYSKETGVPWGESACLGGSDYLQEFLGSSDFLPHEVQEWAGLEGDNPKVKPVGSASDLATLNDNRFTFEEISDIIERDL